MNEDETIVQQKMRDAWVFSASPASLISSSDVVILNDITGGGNGEERNNEEYHQQQHLLRLQQQQQQQPIFTLEYVSNYIYKHIVNINGVDSIYWLLDLIDIEKTEILKMIQAKEIIMEDDLNGEGMNVTEVNIPYQEELPIKQKLFPCCYNVHCETFAYKYYERGNELFCSMNSNMFQNFINQLRNKKEGMSLSVKYRIVKLEEASTKTLTNNEFAKVVIKENGVIKIRSHSSLSISDRDKNNKNNPKDPNNNTNTNNMKHSSGPKTVILSNERITSENWIEIVDDSPPLSELKRESSQIFLQVEQDSNRTERKEKDQLGQISSSSEPSEETQGTSSEDVSTRAEKVESAAATTSESQKKVRNIFFLQNRKSHDSAAFTSFETVRKELATKLAGNDSSTPPREDNFETVRKEIAAKLAGNDSSTASPDESRRELSQNDSESGYVSVKDKDELEEIPLSTSTREEKITRSKNSSPKKFKSADLADRSQFGKTNLFSFIFYPSEADKRENN